MLYNNIILYTNKYINSKNNSSNTHNNNNYVHKIKTIIIIV